MKILLSILAGLLLMPATILSAAEAAPDFTGTWHGTLDTDQVKLRVLFKIMPASAGSELTASMVSIDQSPKEIPATTVRVAGPSLHLEIATIGGTYEGTLDPAGTAIDGKWTQRGGTLPLRLERGVFDETAGMSAEDLAASKEAAEKAAGTWNGTLVAGPQNLRLRVTIAKAANGTATGAIDSLDQGANGIPITVITLTGDKLRLDVRGIGASYEGTLSSDQAKLTGQWQQGGQSFPLELDRAKAE